jgi:uncharacterized membrane protein YeaQ/YmgE (transglycosylase-associated protein family)
MAIDPVFIAIWLVIGIIAGALASFIVKAGSSGLIGDAIVGLVGAAIAGYLLPRVGVYVGAGFVPEVVNAVIGAVILLVVARLAKGMTSKTALSAVHPIHRTRSPAVALRGHGRALLGREAAHA